MPQELSPIVTSRLPVQLVVRCYFGPEKRRDFYVISFSDPEYLAFFTQDAGWADFGASMGGGLFRMKGLKLEIFLRDCFERDFERYLNAPRKPLPFDYVHPWSDGGLGRSVGGRATPHCPHRLTIPGVYSHPAAGWGDASGIRG